MKKFLNRIGVEFLDNTTALWIASQEGYVRKVSQLLKTNANVNMRSIKNDATALYMASNNGHQEIVKMLIEAGADVNIQVSDKRTVLWETSENGQEEINGTTALFTAAENGHQEIVKVLIEAGADVNIQVSDKRTVLWAAAENGHQEIVKILIEAGTVVTKENMDIVKTLLEKRAEARTQYDLRRKGLQINNKWVDVVTREGYPGIQAVVQDVNIHSAIISLAIWGGINIVAWFFLGAKNREFLNGLTANPTLEIYILIYGPLILGAVIFVFAVFGLTTRSLTTILLNGYSLMVVGILNIIYDFVAIDALRPYGYTYEGPSIIWIILGLCQMVWGYRQISLFGQTERWSPAHLTNSELHKLKGILQQFVSTEENTEEGILKAKLLTKSPIGMEPFNTLLSTSTQYTGILLDDFVLIISTKLDGCLAIERKTMSQESFGFCDLGGDIEVKVEGSTKTLIFTYNSGTFLENWCD